MSLGPDRHRHLDSENLGAELEACRRYLTLVAERAIPLALRVKLAPSDLVQETFLDARRRVGDLRAQDRDELRGWLYRVLLLNLAEQKRKFFGTAKSDVRGEVRLDAPIAKGERTGLGDRLVDDRPTPSTAAMGRERLTRLARGLSALPERERQVILWRYRAGLSFAEIGLKLDCSEDAARKRYGRACRRLRALFDEDPT